MITLDFLNKHKHIILYTILLLIIVLLGIRNLSPSYKEDYDKLVKVFEARKLQDSSLLVTQQEMIISKDSDLKGKIEEVEGLKKIKQQVKVVIKYEIDSIPYEVPGMPILTIDTVNYLKLPWSFGREAYWYSYNFTLKKDEIEINKLSFYDSLTISYGLQKKKGFKYFFERATPVVSFQSKNPYSEVKSIQNITVEHEESRIGIDLQAGYGITKVGLSPFVGIGIGYRLRFFKRK